MVFDRSETINNTCTGKRDDLNWQRRLDSTDSTRLDSNHCGNEPYGHKDLVGEVGAP